MGRFLTKDSFKGINSNPKSLNLYAYCEGNPVKYVDPSGHSIVSVNSLAELEEYFAKELEATIDYFENQPSADNLASIIAPVAQDMPVVTYGATGVMAAPLIVPAAQAVVDAIVATLTAAYIGYELWNTYYSKGGNQNINHSDLRHLPEELVSERAKDKSLPKAERKRYKQRNKQKRNSE